MDILPNIFPIHGMLLVKDLQDPTLGGFLQNQLADDIDTIHGIIVRVGEGFITKEGIIPLKTKVGDEVIFLKEHAISLAVFPEFFYLISENMTSGVFGSTSRIDKITQFEGIDIDKLMDQVELESKTQRDPNHSETQD